MTSNDASREAAPDQKTGEPVSERRKIDQEYREVRYLQFESGGGFRRVMSVLGLLTWPLTVPLALLCRCSIFLFRTVSEALSIVPYLFGVILRYEFYRFALDGIGRNVVIEWGAIFLCPNITIGSNVVIGRFNVVHRCDFGDYVLVAERCTFLSGSKQHRTDRRDLPMALQGGLKKKIRINDDVWIGAHSVVADDIGKGAIVAVGGAITKPVPEYTIAIGNPTRLLPRP